MQSAKTPFHIMVKPCGPICNLACDYCYYLPKVNLYPHADYKMTAKLLAIVTHQLIAAQPGDQATFTWQGGEPTLMGLDFFKEAVRLQREITPPGMQVDNILQTNGTLLNPEWCRFFKENRFLVGLSLDGPPDFHNAYRHDKNGRAAFKAVMRAVHLLQKHNVDFNILCCVHQANIHHPLEVYRFLRDEINAQFIQFIPILQHQLDKNGLETQTITDRSVDGKAFGEFLNAIFNDWVRNDVGEIFVQHFDLALGAWAGQLSSLCVFAETCGRALVMEHNGDLYSCDHFVNIDHFLGNIIQTPLAELVESEQQRRFGQAKRDTLPRTCLECEYRFACHGECPKNRDENGLNRICDGYKAFFKHIDPAMRMMTDLLRQNSPPVKIMLRYQSNQ